MDQIGYDTKEVWDKILTDEGSVQDLDFLDNWCFFKGKLIEKIDVPKNYEGTPFKDVFKTFKEINQTVWDKDQTGYSFKRSHAVAYAQLVVVHMNLLKGQKND